MNHSGIFYNCHEGSPTVDIGCPVVQSGATRVVERATFGADYSSDCLDERVVEGSTHENGLWEGCRIAEFSGRREGHSRTLCDAVLKSLKSATKQRIDSELGTDEPF